jgi:Transglycosylase SLT domain
MASVRPRRRVRRARLTVALAAVILVIAALVALLGSGGGHPGLPLPGIGRPARPGDPFAYIPSREADFQARAVTGSENVLFSKSPGGAMATAARVAAFRPLIDSAAAGTGIDPNLLEGIVFVESAGRPDVIAGTDPADASGLTQILAQTGQSLLGMHINLARSRQLTNRIGAAYAAGRANVAVRLERQRAQIDDRFDPRKALAATVRYLKLAEQHFGRADLAVVSYHMGIGNLQQVLDDYDGGRAVPYTQLYFDTSPDHHGAAYDLLAGFGDDSSLYYWRVLGAVQIMHLYRTDPHALALLSTLELDADTNADVLHPPGPAQSFASPNALYDAYHSRTLVRLPSGPARLGLAYSRSIGSLASSLHAPAALYYGLRPAALDMLVELAARVHTLSGGAARLILASAVIDEQYAQQVANPYTGATTGYSFQIFRRYRTRAQALAFQAMLDRLQALDLIAWERTPTTINITVASDASRAIINGP